MILQSATAVGKTSVWEPSSTVEQVVDCTCVFSRGGADLVQTTNIMDLYVYYFAFPADGSIMFCFYKMSPKREESLRRAFSISCEGTL